MYLFRFLNHYNRGIPYYNVPFSYSAHGKNTCIFVLLISGFINSTFKVLWFFLYAWVFLTLIAKIKAWKTLFDWLKKIIFFARHWKKRYFWNTKPWQRILQANFNLETVILLTGRGNHMILATPKFFWLEIVGL